MKPEELEVNYDLKRVGYLRMAWEFLRAKGSIYRFSVRLRQRFGDTYWLPLALPAYVISEPRDLRHVLVTNADNYEKLGALTIAKKFLGDGLLTSEGAYHHRHRRAMQPMFHRQKIAGFAETMVGCAVQRSARWGEGQALDIASEMMHITSSVISKTLFSLDLEHEAHDLSDAIIEAQRCIVDQVKIPLPLPYLTAARERRYQQSVERLDRSLLAIIRERTKPDAPVKDDLLNMLMEIRFEDGGKMSEKELRDEIVTLFVAGHETSANTLTWAFYLLSQNPEAEASLHHELDTVLKGRLPTLSDLPNLPYTDAVMWEAMRLHPPVWIMARHALEEDNLPSGVRVEKGHQVLMVNWAAHRNPQHFPEPEKFRPERFHSKIGIAQSYLPFSAGVRSCVGEPFAKMEIVLTLAALCQKYRLSLEPGQKVKQDLLLLLRPRGEVRMRVENRQSTKID